MFKQKTLALVAATLMGLLAQGAAQAASVESDAGFAAAKRVTFNSLEGLFLPDPVEVGLVETGSSVMLTSGLSTELGAFQRDLGENGLWGARGNLTSGLVDTPTGNGNFVATASEGLRFDFNQGVDGIGAYLNQYRAEDAVNSITLSAYGQNGALLESFSYSISTAYDSYNEGKFLGFVRAQADIYGFSVAGSNVSLDELSFATPVPEPQSAALLLGGLGLLLAWAQRRRPQA
jgi:MYXO-CTERM domain-containing protein